MEKKRGSYKRYLTDDSEEIPITTKYSRALKAKQQKIVTQVNNFFTCFIKCKHYTHVYTHIYL